ncbi:penicillin binding protein PBP4B [Leptotrichia sp. OH3620_COT-345]|uniref:penicillin binding protein PBP4B n=1 Tax=Leptotrichia sp. OH3620_COT-345 TaxID=2491048 RepID=UPI000F650200|nr:penicillin binding protein PBP4B [Leptotrichia sp. OH3620_COT-345]RRD39734.1 penicillin binding protein PBP4B [Leptotrichia sp. OH3620_COT-345]
MKKIMFILFNLVIFLNIFSYQMEKSFPVSKENFDDSILTNNMFEFKAFKGQGYIILEYENFKYADIYINGVKLKTDDFKDKGMKKIDISRITENDKNIFQISNLNGKVNVKIPYPVIIEKSQGKDYNNETLKFLDEFIKAEIEAGLPSVQIAVVKDGKLEFLKSYGYVNNYNQDGTEIKDKIKVTDETVYDLASNTKMYATNYAVMKLVSEKKLNLDDYVYKIFPEFKGSNKEKIQINDLLKHQAGFPPDPQYFNDKYDKDDGIPNGKNDLYAIGKENVKKAILKTPLVYEPKTFTKYFDVDYMLLGLIVEKITSQDLDIYLKENIYNKLNLSKTMFNPLKNGIEKNMTAATELNGNTRDNTIDFINVRKYTIQGEVHDEKAYYSMDGVSGHAGLFSNAYEVAKLAQIIINDGGYGDIKFFDKTTLDNFIKPKDINSSYGLGWRRQGDRIYKWAFSGLASSETIGHTGWTGTLTVIEPSQNLVIVLLTNAKNSRVIDPLKKPNDFYGNHYYTTNYGVISTLIIDAFSNRNSKKDTNLRMNGILKELIIGKYNLIKNDNKYKNSADIKNVIELINLLNKRTEKITSEYEKIKEELKQFKFDK